MHHHSLGRGHDTRGQARTHGEPIDPPATSATANSTRSLQLVQEPLRSDRRLAGGDEETRTPDFLLAKEALYQLSYVPVQCSTPGFAAVGVSGLEPEASALSGQCSNHLS